MFNIKQGGLSMRNRQIRPSVVTTPDNPTVRVKCDPVEDELDINMLINQAITRFEFILGTSFDLQILNLDGTRILALQRFVVTMVRDNVVTSNVDHYQTMTKTMTKRTFSPIGEMFIFDETAASLLNGVDHKPEAAEEDIAGLSTAQLQSIMKNLTGKGFKVGTKREAMVERVAEEMAK
jgi:hypothetical protein